MSVDFMAEQGNPTRDDFMIGEPVNLSNTNAVAVLQLLGLRGDGEPIGEVLGGIPVYGELAGDMEPDLFLGRVLTARALLDAAGDDGTPTFTVKADGGPTITHCGRSPGYFAGRLAELEDIKTTAAAAGGIVVWA